MLSTLYSLTFKLSIVFCSTLEKRFCGILFN